jgi:hypothetical protein
MQKIAAYMMNNTKETVRKKKYNGVIEDKTQNLNK